jgi:tetratricopeptide (TPR) repeat protein
MLISLALFAHVLHGSPAAQSAPLKDLEQSCFHVTDNPRPAEIQAFQLRIDKETGARAAFARGCRLLAEQKFGPAGGEFEQSVRAEPNEAIYHFWFGRATGEQAQRANPIRQPGLARRTKGEFERAIELDSMYVAPREGLLRYYLAAPGFLGGSVDKAREQADVISKLNAYRGVMAHANVAFAAKDTTGMIRLHDNAVVAYPDSATSYMVLFNVQLTRKQWPLAWKALDRLERARPDYLVAKYAIGRAAAESGEQLDRGEAALRAYLRGTPKPNEPSFAATHWRLGQIAEQRGDKAAARDEYQTAVTLDPNFKQAKEALSRLKQA